MLPDFILAGHLTREYLLPAQGQPLLDVPGGSLLYALGGLRVWTQDVGLLARVGEDYPRKWLGEIAAHGADVGGIHILRGPYDQRSLIAYNEKCELTRGTAVSQFARRELPFPKSLLGYQSPPETLQDPRKPEPLAPPPVEIPREYLEVRAVHLAPFDFVSHSQLSGVFKAASVHTITLDPSPGYMEASFLRDLRVVVSGLTAFLPSEEELRSLFWGQTHDLWEMAEALAAYGCEIIVIKRGAQGQYVYDAEGRHKWVLPAYPARLADPTGAGDAFCGGFLAGFRQSYDPLQAAVYGNVSASLKIEGSGVWYPLSVLPGLAQARLAALHDMIREV